jgi:hypothetical protein
MIQEIEQKGSLGDEIWVHAAITVKIHRMYTHASGLRFHGGSSHSRRAMRSVTRAAG